MSKNAQPLVSVVTPVYNGDRYLDECIQSVLAQSYENLEYIIVNNCSTDRTLEIAEKFAQKDARIKIYSNNELLPIMKNWNFALSKISTQSKYCKVVHADDWLVIRRRGFAHMGHCSDFHAESLHVGPDHVIRFGPHKVGDRHPGSVGFFLHGLFPFA